MQNACIAILKNYIKNCIEESKTPDLEQMERLIGTLIEISPPASCTSEDEDDN
jgi:hypothetical protein